MDVFECMIIRANEQLRFKQNLEINAVLALGRIKALTGE